MQDAPTQITYEPELAKMDHVEAGTNQYETRKTQTTESSESHESYNGANSVSSLLLENEKAHPPLGAGASVEHGVEAETTIDAGERSGSLRLDGASCSFL